MFTIIVIAILLIVVWPLFKGWLLIHRVRKAQREAYQNMVDEMRRQQRRQRPAGWSQSADARPEAKKYAPGEGEYVEWEEIEVEQTTTSSTSDSYTHTTTTSTTERIVDAEWEEIS